MFTIIGLIVGGAFFSWVAGKCRGRNARQAFNYLSWGTWLLLLMFLPNFVIPIPLIGDLLFAILKFAPSVICFLLAASSMLKEMRAQKVGEFTDAA